MKVNTFICLAVLACFLFTGCTAIKPKPFQLKIDVNFSADEAQVAVRNHKGQLIAWQNYTKEGKKWQKSQARFFQCQLPENSGTP